MSKSKLHADVSQLGEFGRGIVASDRQVSGRRPEILPQSKNVHVPASQVTHAGHDLVPLFAHTENDAGFGQSLRGHPTSSAEEVKRAIIAPTGTGQAVEPLTGFEVVIEDVGLGFENDG